MKTLLLLRHAKSPHPSGVADHDRPILPEAGRRVARLARELAVAGVVPDLVLCSDAVRALATARLYAAAVRAPEPLARPRLYAPGGPEEILEEIQSCGTAGEVVLVVGHNPGLEETGNLLTLRPVLGPMEAGALALFMAPIGSWADLRPGRAGLRGSWSSR